MQPEVLAALETSLVELGFEVAVHPSYPSPRFAPRIDAEQASRWADLALVVGGDGTLLKALHETGGRIPVLGVNSGDSIGYLMEVTLDQAPRALELIARGEYKFEERLIGFVSVGNWSSIFVNEVVAITARCGSLIGARVEVDGETLMEGRLDGLIVATPTGSTAYALSAGGPIVDPSLRAFALVPLAPFTALLKPIIVSSARKVSVTIGEKCMIVVDGVVTHCFSRCTALATEAPISLRLIKLPFSESVSSRLRRRLLDLTPSGAPAGI